MAFVRKPIPSFAPPSTRIRAPNSFKDRPLPPPPVSEDRYVRAPGSESGRPSGGFFDHRAPAGQRSYIDERVADKDNPHNYNHNAPHYKPSLREDSRHYKRIDSDRKCSNPLTACSNAIVRGLESFFYWLGFNIAKYPYVVFIITILLVLAGGSGVRTLREETDGAKLWTPTNSLAQDDLAIVRAWYPELRRINTFIIEADNVLTTDILKSMAEIDDKVGKINEDGIGHISQLCYKVGDDCLRRSILQLWNYNLDTINALSEDDIQNTVNNVIESNADFDISDFLAGIEENENGTIIKARAAFMSYTLEADFLNETQLEIVRDWEGKFLEIGEKGIDGLTIYRFARRSNADEGSGAIFGDIILLSSGYGILLIFVILVLGRFNRIEHKFYISFVGISCVIFALAVSVGLGSYAKILFSPLNNILPFLLLGLGVDDMFVIVSALDNLPPNIKAASVPERMGEALKTAGVSITVTSLTDMLAFGTGIITTLPALRSFCTYCLVGILFTFIFQSTYFVAWLSIDERRADDHRDACFFCFRIVTWSPGTCSRYLLVKRFFRDFYSKIILTIPAKVIMIIITCGLLAGGIYGTYFLEQDSAWTKFIPEDSYARDYINAVDRYFPTDATAVQSNVYLGDIDYFGNFTVLEELHRNLQADEWIDEDSVITWWHSYYVWLNTTTNMDITDQLDSEGLPFNETIFYDILFQEFLTSPEGLRFAKSDITTTPEDRILYSRGSFRHVNLTGSSSRVTGMQNARDIIGATGLPRDNAFVYSRRYLNFEGERAIQMELYRNLGLAFLCVAIMTLLLIANLLTSIFICLCVILTVVDTGGLMYFWGLDIDTVTSIILILAMGLSIDFSAHIGHAFMTAKGRYRKDRVRVALTRVGPAVFFGGFSTFLAFILLVFSKSYVFQTFFKVFLGIVLFGMFHGLAFLPVILSLLGPRSYQTASHELDIDTADVGREGWDASIYLRRRTWHGFRRNSPPSDRSGPLSSGNSGDTGIYSAGELYRQRIRDERQQNLGEYGSRPNGYPPHRPRQEEYIPRGTVFTGRQYGRGPTQGSAQYPSSFPAAYSKPANYQKPLGYMKPGLTPSDYAGWYSQQR